MVSVKGVSKLATPSVGYNESSSSEKPFHLFPGSGSVITNLRGSGHRLSLTAWASRDKVTEGRNINISTVKVCENKSQYINKEKEPV